MNKPTVAIFDLDNTLIYPSVWLNARHRLSKKLNLTPNNMLKFSFYAAGYKFGFFDVEAFWGKNISLLAACSEEEVRSIIHDVVNINLEKIIEKPLEYLNQHQKKGHTTIIISALPSPLVQDIGDALGVTHCKGTDICITTRTLTDICAYKEGKAIIAKRYQKELGFWFQDVACYADSISDIPLMELCGSPVAVNPDKRLRRHAVKRGWQVIYDTTCCKYSETRSV